MLNRRFIFETLGDRQTPNNMQSKPPNTTAEVPENLFTYHVIRLPDEFSLSFKSTPFMRSSLFWVVTQPILLVLYRRFGRELIFLVFKSKQSKTLEDGTGGLTRNTDRQISTYTA
jgi:hypothetical protein